MAETQPKQRTTAIVAPLILLAFGLLSWIIFLAGTSAQQHKGDDILNEPLDVTAMQWLLVAVFPLLLIAALAAMLVGPCQRFRLPIGILLGVALAWFGYALDSLGVLDRQLDGFGGSFARSTRAAEAGGILCSLVLAAAIILTTMDTSAAARSGVERQHLPPGPSPQPMYTVPPAQPAPQYVAQPLAHPNQHVDYHAQPAASQV